MYYIDKITYFNLIDIVIICKEGCHPVGGCCNQPGQCQCNSG